MAKAAIVVGSLRQATGFRAITEADISKPLDEQDHDLLDAIQFFLNHFEFIAAGIRHGDLDEDMLKGTLRGMVERYCAVGAVLIDAHRTAQGPKTYEHLIWLNRRWTVRRLDSRIEFLLLALIFFGVAANAALYTPAALESLTALQLPPRSARTSQPKQAKSSVAANAIQPKPPTAKTEKAR
jgi:hypothetical protein